MAIVHTYFSSPLGPLLLVARGDALSNLHILGGKYVPRPEAGWERDDAHALLLEVQAQLQAYFAGDLRQFDLPLAAQGTAFQQRAWQALLDIPYGQTWTYGGQAARMGQPRASRAVGAANGKNPISIIIPCHRVRSATGALTGYAGGIQHKAFLLRHEGAL